MIRRITPEEGSNSPLRLGPFTWFCASAAHEASRKIAAEKMIFIPAPEIEFSPGRSDRTAAGRDGDAGRGRRRGRSAQIPAGARCPLAPSCGVNAGCRPSPHPGDNANPFRREAETGGFWNQVVLVDGCPGSLVLIRRIHADIEIAGKAVRTKTSGDGARLGVGGYGEGGSAIQECSASAMRRKSEDHHPAGHTVMVFILYLNDRLARGAKANVVQRVIAIEDGDLQVPGRRGLGERRERGEHGDTGKSQCRDHDAPGSVSAHVGKSEHNAS